MPRQSQTSNVRKICGCGRAKWSGCSHPWYVDYKAPKDHPRRPDERYRKNLDLAAGRHAGNLREAQDEARRAITAWLDGRDPANLQPGDRPTLAQVIEAYRKRPAAAEAEAFQAGPINATKVQDRPLGEWRAAEITREALDAFRQQRPKVAGNRNLAYLRAMFNWAVADGLVPRSPFRVGDVAVVRLAREEVRTRRLQADEETRLLEKAGPHLRPLIVGALESGCRLGELLSLQWHQVRFSPRAELFLPAQKTKAKKDRRIPLSTALKTLLEGRRNDPAGEPLPAEAFVFGDELGRRRRSIKSAWRLTCKRAEVVGLHFHDLRREAASRWMQNGVALADIQRWLGHHNISQTSKYLAASLGDDHSAMEAYERRIGRLPQIDKSSGSTGSEQTSTALPMDENTQQNPIGPGASGTIH